MVEDAAGLHSAWSAAAQHDAVLCERMVGGTEITIGVLGDDPPEALPTLEIVSHRPLYDYAAKYTAGQSEHIIQLEHLRQYVGLRGYGQRDPLNEYKSEALTLFEGLLIRLD